MKSFLPRWRARSHHGPARSYGFTEFERIRCHGDLMRRDSRLNDARAYSRSPLPPQANRFLGNHPLPQARSWLVDHLVSNNAVNIHMGLSPYYRGSSCNFWAVYDDNPHSVGATIHRISKGLDSGPILYHCLPVFEDENIFEFTMKSVLVAHLSLADRIRTGKIFRMNEVSQSRNEDDTKNEHI